MATPTTTTSIPIHRVAPVAGAAAPTASTGAGPTTTTTEAIAAAVAATVIDGVTVQKIATIEGKTAETTVEMTVGETGIKSGGAAAAEATASSSNSGKATVASGMPGGNSREPPAATSAKTTAARDSTGPRRMTGYPALQPSDFDSDSAPPTAGRSSSSPSDGIGAAPYILDQRFGKLKAAFAWEIDGACRRVAEERLPWLKQRGDLTKDSADDVASAIEDP